MKTLTLLAIVIGLLGMNGVARAESWVLWKYDGRFVSPSWEVVTAYPDYNSCIRNEALYCEAVATTYGKECIKYEGHYFRPYSDAITMRWKCLPSSIDPRK